MNAAQIRQIEIQPDEVSIPKQNDTGWPVAGTIGLLVFLALLAASVRWIVENWSMVIKEIHPCPEPMQEQIRTMQQQQRTVQLADEVSKHWAQRKLAEETAAKYREQFGERAKAEQLDPHAAFRTRQAAAFQQRHR